MADIEKVIKGLEHCKRESEHIDDNPCNGCPYYELKECQQMMADALELLKEYKRKEVCPCTHCMEWECDEVCEEYKKWKDT